MKNNTTWTRSYHHSSSRQVRLVCFPHAGGSASYYFPLSAALSPSVEVLSVQYPGRHDRAKDALVSDIRDLAKGIELDLHMHPIDNAPLAFFGHSMGAIVAFEVALQMQRRRGVGPIALIASGRKAPSCSRKSHPIKLDDAEIMRELQALSGTDFRLLHNREIMEMLLPILRNDFMAVNNYQVGTEQILDTPITSFVGEQDPHTKLAEAASWENHTCAGFKLYRFHGGHFYLEQNVDELARIISKIIAIA